MRIFPEALVTTLLKSGVVAGTGLAQACCPLQGLTLRTSSLSGARCSPRPSRRRPFPPAMDLLGMENFDASFLPEEL